jgi:hypothetical protein
MDIMVAVRMRVSFFHDAFVGAVESAGDDQDFDLHRTLTLGVVQYKKRRGCRNRSTIKSALSLMFVSTASLLCARIK